MKAAIVLRAISANGLTRDLEHRDRVLADLDGFLAERRQLLIASGILPGQPGSLKALRALLARLAAGRRDLVLARTPTGEISTSKDALAELAEADPVVQAYLEYQVADKLRGSFLGKMGRGVLHPSFDVLKNTGRTSSFGELNAQNLPRDDRVRRCIVAADGRVLIAADYAAIEMVTLAQALLAQFGLDSALARALNASRDVHRMLAALALGKAEADVTKEERQRAKPFSFGKPGGLGHDGLKEYARVGYNVLLDDATVEALSEAWFALFPEMREFLRNDADTGLQVATFFGLTPWSHFEHTDRRTFLDHPANRGHEFRPHAALGAMCLKVLREPEPVTQSGRPYSNDEVDYFWTRVAARLDELPAKLRTAALRRLPSRGLRNAVLGLVGRGPVFTLTGRLRAVATFAARHNTVFQGLASDGAKVALWNAWRAGHRLVNFVHDELLFEVPADSDLGAHVDAIRTLMTEAMREVTPDMAVAIEAVVTTAWSKKAEPTYDASGRLVPWAPTAEDLRDSSQPLAVII